MSNELIYEKRGKVAYITLNRPEVMNAMNPEVWEGLTEAWLAVRDDPEVWVAIVTGSGERAFSSGADLKALAKYHEEASREGRPYSSPLPEILRFHNLG